ncbi:hypothetical protein CTRI78_v004764 [Colletotrichum trifolii]|uniref:Uncharacterized protein n=1 Tax=Colletotrichum trifolii TaxID=5466 RepID=A0A4R8RG91_COLTR|nr:hypothetical protein CTRI78_v004764 [Colletotrichum trifolii]
MSDTETPEQSASTPTPQPTPKVKGKGRGRGRKPAVPKKEAPKPAPAAGTGRRGRFKQFADDKVQAAYERQRELKSQYAALANAVKPALQDLASRDVKNITRDPEYHSRVPEFEVVTRDLQQRLDKRLAVLKNKYDLDRNMTLASRDHCAGAVQEIFQNGVEDLEDSFLNAQLCRLDLLEHLYEHGLPVDLVDGNWTYKQISDKEADDFGIYEVYVDGRLVPYPQLVEGTEAHALRQAAWSEPQPKETAAPPVATSAAASTSASAAPRTKRRARDQPDGQPAPKRTAGDLAPANHIAGIMSAQHAHVEDESNESTPAPEGPVAADQREPPLPAKASEPDEYGCRQVNRPPAKNGAMIANRIIVPPAFQFDDDEIGYRDSTNSAKHGATVAKRGKYFGKPNSNTWHYDPLLARWDARLVEDDDMDKELVEQHRVHPRYGYFLPGSRNKSESPEPLDMTKALHPTVYLTPSGKTIHSSRVVPAAKIERALKDKPIADRMAAALRRVCERHDLEASEIETEQHHSIREMAADYDQKRRVAESIEKQKQESESVEDSPVGSPLPANESDLNVAGLLDLIQATEAVETELQEPEPVEEKPAVIQPPTPARPNTRAYDAVRDVFGVAEPAPTEPATPVVPPQPVVPQQPVDLTGLMALADASAADYPPQHVDVAMADAPPVQSVPVDGPPQHHMEPVYPTHAEPQMSIPPPSSWVEPRVASPGVDSRMHSSMDHPNQLPPVRSVETPHMRHSIEGANDTRRPSMYPDHNVSYGEHLPPPHTQQLYMSSEPMIDPRLYSAPMDGQIGHHSYHSTAYDQPQHSYHMSAMPMQSGQLPLGPPPHQPGSSSRMPFTNPVQDRSSPLPPLRPSRGRKSIPTAPDGISPDHQQAQQQPPHSFMSTNSGSFYPPGPPRPYHNGYTNEQPGMPMMSQFSPSPYGPPQGGPPQQPGIYGHAGMSPTYSSIAPAQSPPTLQFVQQQPNEPHTRSRAGSGSSTPNSAASARYPKLAPAPLPAHRVGWPQGPELRTVQYDYKENIKDYAPTEPPPRRAPIQIRGWNINNNKIQRQRPDENGDERRSSR